MTRDLLLQYFNSRAWLTSNNPKQNSPASLGLHRGYRFPSQESPRGSSRDCTKAARLATLASTSACQSLGRGRARPLGTAPLHLNHAEPGRKRTLAFSDRQLRAPEASGWSGWYQKAGEAGRERDTASQRRTLPPRPPLRRGDHRESGVEDAAADPEGRQLACSPVPRTLGPHPRPLLPGVHQSGRKDDSLAPRSGRWQMRAENGGAGDRLRTGPLRRPPARRAGPGADGAGRAKDAPDPPSLAAPRSLLGPGAARHPLWEPGSAPRPGEPVPTSPSPGSLGGAPGPPGPAPVGPPAQESPRPAVPSLPQPPPVLSRAARAEVGSPRNSAVGAGVSTAEQSPRPAVLAGNCMRTRPGAPARPRRSPPGRCAPRPVGTGPGPPKPPRPLSGKPNVRLSSPSRPNFTRRAREVGLPGTRGAWARGHKLATARRR